MRLYNLVLIISLINIATSKFFEKCELAKLLEGKHQISKEEVKKWVCIAQYESTFNTAAINHHNWDGSKDYGLLQLNSRYWCGNEHGQNVCNMPCSDLLDANLTDDLKCAKRIVEDTKRWKKIKDGFVAWVAYKKRCQNRNLDKYMLECWRPEANITDNIIPLRDSSQVKEDTTSVKDIPLVVEKENSDINETLLVAEKENTNVKETPLVVEKENTNVKETLLVKKDATLKEKEIPSRASGIGQLITIFRTPSRVSNNEKSAVAPPAIINMVPVKI